MEKLLKVGRSLSCENKLLRKPTKTTLPSSAAVIHNGSFMTEAFPVQLHEVYEDIEVLPADEPITYAVFDADGVHTEPDGGSVGTFGPIQQFFQACTDSNDAPQCIATPISNAQQTTEGSTQLTSTDSIATSIDIPSYDADRSEPTHWSEKSLSSIGVDPHSTVECTNSDGAVKGCPSASICNPKDAKSLPRPYAWRKRSHDEASRVGHSDTTAHGNEVIDVIQTSRTTTTKITKLSAVETGASLKQPPNETIMTLTNHGSSNEKQVTEIECDATTSTNQLADSLSGMTAFLTMPVTSIADADTPSNGETALQILNVRTSSGVIELVDGEGRTFCIQPSDTTTVTSDSLLHSITVPDGTLTLGEGDAGHDKSTNQAVEQPVDNESPSKAKRLKKCKGSPGKRRSGWPKGKLRKHDKLRIKAPVTAYLIFAKRRRKELMMENPNYTFSEVTVIMGREWTALDPVDKIKYQKQADLDQNRFYTELKIYQQTDEYQKLLKRKREEAAAKLGGADEEDLGYVEEEYTLFCHICNQRFSSRHNRKEHLAGRQHLKNLEAELRKQKMSVANIAEAEKLEAEKGKCDPNCCKHCVNRAIDISEDVSLDVNSHMEAFLYKHSLRESELLMLRQNARRLKDINSQLSKELITIQEQEVKLRQEIQANRQWQLQLAASMENLKMVPTLFGVINF